MKNFYPVNCILLVFFLFSQISLKAQVKYKEYLHEVFHGPVKSIEHTEYADSIGGNINSAYHLSFDSLGQIKLYEERPPYSDIKKSHYSIPIYRKINDAIWEYSNPFSKELKRVDKIHNLLSGELNFSKDISSNLKTNLSPESTIESMETFEYTHSGKNRLIKNIIESEVSHNLIDFSRYEYRGDSTIISYEYLPSVRKEIIIRPRQTILIAKDNLLLSLVHYEGNYPILNMDYTYETFDKWGNWTKRRAKHSGFYWEGTPFAGEIVQQRNILYYE
jgi:hypothetical protein